MIRRRSEKEFGRRFREAGPGLMGLAAALILGAVLRWNPPSQASDLGPRPDALEYEEGARNLASGKGFCLIVESKKFAPRYPFGFPVLLAPVLRLWTDSPGSGVVVVLACALGTIAAAWRL